MSILDQVDLRADWLARAHTLIMAIQSLETAISIAMLDRPNGTQARLLTTADQQLGIAATSITEAASKIRSLR